MSVNQTSSSVLGSESWTGVDKHASGDEQHQRAMALLTTVNWNLLLSISSSLRNGLSCTFAEKFSVGHFNLVRRIIFADGVSWIARVKMPVLKNELRNKEILESPRFLTSEVATMRFIKAKTSIPVPEVYGYDAEPNNDVGAPYVLMAYISGTTAKNLARARGLWGNVYGTTDQDRNFREQMAKIQVELSRFAFDRIGSLYQNKTTSEFFIGPEVETGKGPWTSSIDYYNDIADHQLRDCAKWADTEVRSSISFANPIIFKHLISTCGRATGGKSSFPLVNRDFGAHNLLVNEDFEIVGVIDLDFVIAAPIEVVAQFPSLTGLEPEVPGRVETRPFAIERIKKAEPKIKAYRDLINEVEASCDKPTEARFGSIMLSDAASLYQGLHDYESHQKDVNDDWMEAYLRILRKQSDLSSTTSANSPKDRK